MRTVKEPVETGKAPEAIGPYSQAIRAGEWLFCSGQIALDSSSGKMIPGGVPEQTCRALENLVTSAMEATNGSGTLTIRTDQQLDATDELSSACLSVIDTGVGIPEDFVRDQLFKPFTTTKAEGLGLGLYQCRSIVKAHGGRLTVNSSPGRGTTVQMVLDTVPGNVREPGYLKGAVSPSSGEVLGSSDLEITEDKGQETVSLRKAREQADHRTVIDALRRTGGNISRAAIELGVSRPTLHNLLGKLDLDARAYRSKGNPESLKENR